MITSPTKIAKRELLTLAKSKMQLLRLRSELKPGWWLSRTPSMWVRVRSAKDQLLSQTRGLDWRKGFFTIKGILKWGVRLLTFRAQRIRRREEGSESALWEGVLLCGDQDLLLFDWSAGVVARESSRNHFTSEYFSHRERLSRYVSVPELVTALPPNRQVERHTQGRPVLSLSSSVQCDATAYFLRQFERLAASEHLDVPPAATMREALSHLAATGTLFARELGHRQPVLDRLMAVSNTWSVVPSHGDAVLHNAIYSENSYVLIDTAKCGPRYEWHDSIHLMMFSGSKAVLDSVMEGRLTNRFARACLNLDPASIGRSASFEELVLGFVLIGATEAAKSQPFVGNRFAQSLRWHLARPGVREVLDRIPPTG
jgi:hypothetical protein